MKLIFALACCFLILASCSNITTENASPTYREAFFENELLVGILI